MLIDTHCHLADSAYDADRAEVLARAWAAGVARVVVIGDSPESAERALALAGGRAPALRHGRHPSPRRLELDRRGRATGCAARLRRPAGGGRRRDGPRLPLRSLAPRERQRAAFEAQLALAREAGKPAVIHAREADDDVAAILRAHPGRHRHPALVQQRPRPLAGGAGPPPLCVVQRDGDLQELAPGPGHPGDAARPLLVETDGPYLAPVPHRGKRNEPAFVRQVAERIAGVRGLPVEELIAADRAPTRRASSAFSHLFSRGSTPAVTTFPPTSPSRRPPSCGPSQDVAAELGLGPDDILPYGRYKAKISAEAVARGKPTGRLVLVTGINPTPAGEGKSTVTVGVSQALRRLGKKVVVVHPRAVARPGVRRQGRRGRRRVRPGRPDGRDQPALHRRFPRHHLGAQPALGDAGQPPPPGQRARPRSPPDHLAPHHRHERPGAPLDRDQPRRASTRGPCARIAS